MTGSQKATVLTDAIYTNNKKNLVWSEKILGHPATLYFSDNVALLTRGMRDVSWILKGTSIPIEVISTFSHLDGQIIHRKGPRRISSVAQACITIMEQTARFGGEVRFRIFDGCPRSAHDMTYQSRISLLKTLFKGHDAIEVAIAYEVGTMYASLGEFRASVANNVQITGPDTHSIILRDRDRTYGKGDVYKIRMTDRVTFSQMAIDKVVVLESVNGNAKTLQISVKTQQPGVSKKYTVNRTPFNVDMFKFLTMSGINVNGVMVCIRTDSDMITNISTGWM